MNKQADTKKMIYLQERDLIAGIANDEAKVLNRSTSSIMEQHILKSTLPHNSVAARFARGLYSGVPVNLPDTFADIFDYLAVDPGRAANLRPLVSFYYSLSRTEVSFPGTEPEWVLAASQMTSIAETLNAQADGNQYHRKELLREAMEMKNFISGIEISQPIQFSPVICVLLSSWTYLGNQQCTFRLLSAISRIQRDIRNDAETRFEFVRILREEWSEETT